MRNLVPFAVVGSNAIIEVVVTMMMMIRMIILLLIMMVIIIFRMKMEESQGVGAILGALLTLKSDSIAISR